MLALLALVSLFAWGYCTKQAVDSYGENSTPAVLCFLALPVLLVLPLFL